MLAALIAAILAAAPASAQAASTNFDWPLFGISNQLLAALTLLGVTVWLWRTRRETWVWLVTGLPCVWMYAMSSWALVLMTWPKFSTTTSSQRPMTNVMSCSTTRTPMPC